MTREEAITQVRLLRDMAYTMNDNRMKEATDLAIEALQTEPCEDAISRQAAIDGLARIAKAKAKSDAPVQPEPFINKPCVSEGACHEDKMKVLEKIKAEMLDVMVRTYQEIKAIINKYMEESEVSDADSD